MGQIVAVGAVNVLQSIQNGLSAALQSCSHFAHQHGSHHCVLIPGVGALQIAAAFLEAKEEFLFLSLLLQLQNLAADVLEAGEYRFHGNTVVLRNPVSQRRGNNAAYHNGPFRNILSGRPGLEDIVHQQTAQLVAGELPIAALSVRNGDGHAVAVRVGSQNHVAGSVLCHLVAFIQSCIRFRIGILTGLEIAVGLLLHLNDCDIDSQAPQNLPHRLITGAAQRGIDDVKARFGNHFRLHSLSQNCLVVPLPQGLVDVVNQAAGSVIFEGICLRNKVRNLADFLGDHCGRFISHLAAVRSVALNPVICAGVVAGGNHNTTTAAQLPNRIGQHGGRCQTVIKIGGNPLLCKRHCTNLSKQLGIVPGVVANGSFLGQIRFRKPGGHALGRSAYSVDIQPVAACTHDTTHTCRTELQVAAKPALEFLLVIPNSKQLCFYCLGKTCITPKFVSLHVVHFPNLLFDNTYKKGSSSHIC